MQQRTLSTADRSTYGCLSSIDACDHMLPTILRSSKEGTARLLTALKKQKRQKWELEDRIRHVTLGRVQSSCRLGSKVQDAPSIWHCPCQYLRCPCQYPMDSNVCPTIKH